MYGKLINGRIEALRYPLRGEKDVFTTDAELLRERGFKPVRYEDYPDIGDTEYTTPIYSETATEIVVSWEIHESDEATTDDYINALSELGVDVDEEG